MADTNDELVLDAFPLPKRVSIKSANGEVRKYLVHETNGPKEYWECIRQSQRLASSQDGEHLIQMPELVVRMISLCLTTTDGKPVPESVVQGWGVKAKEAVFREVQKMNGMAPDSADEEGKGSGGVASSGGGTTSPNDSGSEPSKTPATTSAPPSSSAGS